MKVYVGKATDSQGNIKQAKIISELNKAFYDEDGEEKSTEKIEYLFHTNGFEWLKSSGGKIVPDAVTVAGCYIGRAEIDGTTVVGRVDLKWKQLIASYYGKILNLSEYDVLVFKPSSKLAKETRKKNSFSMRSRCEKKIFISLFFSFLR